MEKINIMTGLKTKKILFLPYQSEQWESYPFDEGIALWSKRFTENSYPALVIHPTFTNAAACYYHASIKESCQSLGITKPEKDFIQSILQNTDAFANAKIAYLPPGYWGDKIPTFGTTRFLKPLNEMNSAVQYLSKESVLAKILPDLKQYLNLEESSIYLPVSEAGYYALNYI